MTTVLNQRPFRLGLREFKSAAHLIRYWIAFGLALAVIGTPTAAVIWPDADIILWAASISVLQWFAAATAGIWLYNYLPVYLAHGVTRREITVAYLVFGALATAALFAIAVAGFAAEHAMLALVAEPLDTWGEAFAKSARYLLVTPVYFFAGAAVTALALRLGKGAAFVATTFLLVPTAVFAGTLAIEFFDYDFDAGAWTFLAWLGSGLAFLAALVATVVLALRSVPIQGKQA